MAGVGILETDDKRAKFGQRKPHRHLSPEHAALGRGVVFAPAGSLAGDDEYNFAAVRLGAAQEARQLRMRLCLREAVQIEAGIYRFTAARDTFLKPSA